jgi:hypothetical protein
VLSNPTQAALCQVTDPISANAEPRPAPPEVAALLLISLAILQSTKNSLHVNQKYLAFDLKS